MSLGGLRYGERSTRKGLDMTKFLTSAPNEFVADMICERLTEAGVQPLSVGVGADYQ
jgi:hypothetical protein